MSGEPLNKLARLFGENPPDKLTEQIQSRPLLGPNRSTSRRQCNNEFECAAHVGVSLLN